MLDLEELLHKDGFSDYDDEKHGDFDDEKAPDFAWSAEILKPDIKLDASQLISMMSGGGGGSSGSSSSSSSSSSGGLGGGLLGGMLGGLLGGSSGSSGISSGSPSGAAALASAGPMAGMIQGQATQFIETIKSSVREVRLTVTWKDGTVTQNLSASQIVVILANSVGKAGQTQGGATSGSGDTATRPPDGTVGIPPPGGQR
jgi:general secretion pathway protein I